MNDGQYILFCNSKTKPKVTPMTQAILRQSIIDALDHFDRGYPVHAENDIKRLAREIEERGVE
jgi:hypothetical protein